MVTLEKLSCLDFSTQNPEISLPNVLDDDSFSETGVCTLVVCIFAEYGPGALLIL